MSSLDKRNVKGILRSREFWIGTALISATGLIFYDWYRDRYASASERYERIVSDYEIPLKELHQIRQDFLKEMEVGLNEANDPKLLKKKSSLKMLSSNVFNIPTGDEDGVYYTLDWGGTNYRVIRMEFHGKQAPLKSDEYKVEITKEYQKTQETHKLFDYLAKELSEHMNRFDEYKTPNKTIYPIGFTFSFPMRQPALNEGILLEWTKGFDIPGVVGKNVVDLMHQSFKKLQVPGEIKAVVNDTVGTLLSCAYEEKNVRIGLILGTGTNACYIEPKKNNEIINIEWGNFNKRLPRRPIDFLMDEYTPNRGVQFNEKMISGMYIGEMCRLLLLEVFREKITNYGASSPLNEKWQMQSQHVSELIKYYNDMIAYNNNNNDNKYFNDILNCLKNRYNINNFDFNDCKIFCLTCKLIVNRSADLAATCLTAVLEKTGAIQSYKYNQHNSFELPKIRFNDDFANIDYVTIGIDGSVYQRTPGYQERMLATLENILGSHIAKRIKMVHSADGSGRGAALAVAATHDQSTVVDGE